MAAIGMFLGLRTIIYHAADLARAREWYTLVLGKPPYFNEPFYVGFNVGGYELGLDPDTSGVSFGNNQVVYWGVANVDAVLQRMIELGATRQNDVQDVGGGIRVAAVVDPFGNVIGLIENPHFKLDG